MSNYWGYTDNEWDDMSTEELPLLPYQISDRLTDWSPVADSEIAARHSRYLGWVTREKSAEREEAAGGAGLSRRGLAPCGAP